MKDGEWSKEEEKSKAMHRTCYLLVSQFSLLKMMFIEYSSILLILTMPNSYHHTNTKIESRLSHMIMASKTKD